MRLKNSKNTIYDMRFVDKDDTDCFEALLEEGDYSLAIIKPIDYYSEYKYNFDT